LIHAENLRVATVVSNPFAENTYISQLEGRNDCLVFDPGLEPDKIFAEIEQHGLQPAAIVLTHGHSDHIGGNSAMRQRWRELPIVIGRGDAPKLTDPNQNLSAPFGTPLVSPPADQLLDDGETYEAAGQRFEVLEMPGHSSGHVIYVWRGDSTVVVFGGDVLFAGSIGRTDFPDGSFEQLRDAIHNKLFTLPDDTIVLPGHGPATTVGDEKRINPYVGAPAGYAG